MWAGRGSPKPFEDLDLDTNEVGRVERVPDDLGEGPGETHGDVERGSRNLWHGLQLLSSNDGWAGPTRLYCSQMYQTIKMREDT